MQTNPVSPQQRRENPEPTERSRPMPWGLLLLAALTTAFCAIYVAIDATPTPPELGDQRTVAELRAAAPAASAAREGTAIDGAALYAARCAACHQATGAGVPGVFPPLVGSEWLAGSERRLAALVLHGVTGPITVKGQTFNGAMPAFGSQLADAELAALLSHLRATWGSGAGAVTAATVAEVRQATQARTAPYSGEAELKVVE